MNVYDEIRVEREYQDKRWGHVADDTLNTPWMWVAYIAAYSTKWMVGSFLPLHKDVVVAFRVAMVKTAAIAIAAVESLDRQREKNGQPFYEGFSRHRSSSE